MQPMRFFLDTHDRHSHTFPASFDRDQFSAFFAKYEQAARQEGVVVVRAHVGLADGLAVQHDRFVGQLVRQRLSRLAGHDFVPDFPKICVLPEIRFKG